MEYRYRNITISGLPGSGSTTLLRALEKQLSDWAGFSGGEFMRAYALEKQIFRPVKGMHHDSRHYEDDFDRKIDFGMRQAMVDKDRQIMEAWLSGFMAQGVDGCLKVLMECERSMRIDRIVNRDEASVEEVKKNVVEREQANLDKWARLYASEWKEWVVGRGVVGPEEPIDFWNPKLYDVVIDTYSSSKEDTLRQVMDLLEVKAV